MAPDVNKSADTDEVLARLEAESIGTEKRPVFKDLNEFEIAKLSSDLAEISIKIDEADDRLTAARVNHREETKGLKDRKKRVLQLLRARGEMVDVQCFVIPIEGKRHVRLVGSGGEDMGTRPMTAEEAQLGFQFSTRS